MFSVVIPLYNKELSIQNTINSVLQQSFQDFEIVVVNDGSTDTSVAKVEEIEDSRIRIVHQQNQGVSAARNKGVVEAKFSWIAFLDGDDLWETNHLQEVDEMIRLFPQEKVFATSFEYSDTRPMFRHPRESKIFKVDDYFKDALKENMMWTSIVVINKELFNKVGRFNTELSRGEDLDLWARLVRQFPLIKSSMITAVYRVEAENRTNLIKDLSSTHIYHLNLTDTLSESEYRYYVFLILRRMYDYYFKFNFKEYKEIKKKYKISFLSFFCYSIARIKGKILNRITRALGNK